jgi:rubrerythrin
MKGASAMADYYPLIARAVAGLPQNTDAARRALYDRARNALVAQLRGQTPTLRDSEIARERRALDDAIGKVETERQATAQVETVRARSNQLEDVAAGKRVPELSMKAAMHNTGTALKTCEHCGNKVQFDKDWFCPICGTQPLLTVGGKNIRTFARATFVIGLAGSGFFFFLTGLEKDNPISLYFVGIALLCFVLFIVGTPSAAADYVASIMKRNIKSNKENNRRQLRRDLIGRASFLGAASFVGVYTLAYFQKLSLGGYIDFVQSLTSLIVLNNFLGGFIPAVLGSLAGSFIGLVYATAVVPVKHKKPVVSQNKHVAGQVQKS